MVEGFDYVVDLINENQTRKQYIDPELEKAGWMRTIPYWLLSRQSGSQRMKMLSREKFTKKIKEDVELKDFLESNLLIQNIRDGKGITSGEIKQLETQLSALRPELKLVIKN